jgi:hypothetical protein
VTPEKKKILLIGALGIGAYLLFAKSGAAADTQEPGGYSDEPPPPPPVEVPTYAAPLQTYLAIENRRLLIKYAAGNMTLINAYNQMNDQEINASWEYVWSFLLRNLKLYGVPGTYADGNYNVQLYAAIQAIRTKYKIF